MSQLTFPHMSSAHISPCTPFVLSLLSACFITERNMVEAVLFANYNNFTSCQGGTSISTLVCYVMDSKKYINGTVAIVVSLDSDTDTCQVISCALQICVFCLEALTLSLKLMKLYNK